MAEVNGPVQNRGQIRWWYAVDGYSSTAQSVTVQVDAYYRQDSYSQQYNGSKSWAGHWGSGSGEQGYFLSPGGQVRIVAGGRQSVPLTGSARTITFSVSTSHFYGTTGSTLSVPIPAAYALAPSNLSVTRESDVSHRLNWARNSTYSSVVVQRRANDGVWQQVARPSGNAFTWTDTGTSAGNKYDYRVAGVGGGGQSGWSGVTSVFTSPLAPTGVEASRVGSNISVDVLGKPAYASTFNIRDGSTVVASGVSVPWTHVNPAAADAHTYTVQGVVSGLAGAWSGPSNTVQLISQPLAPIGLAPNGGVAVADVATLFKWKHNPVDASPQSSASLRYRVKGVAAWTTRTVTTAQQLSVVLPAAEYEWQVQTKGAHASFSPWSAVASLTLIDRPGVAVTSPELVWAGRTVTVKWSWLQAQGRPQSAWEVEITSADGLVERRTGSGATTSVAMTARLADGEYMVTVRAATGDVWSEPAVQVFVVAVPPAAPADMSGVWSEESGAVTIEVQDGRGPARAPVTNHFPNPRFVGDGTWVELRKNLAIDPGFTSLRKKLGSATSNMPSGGGASLSIDSAWAAVGDTSLRVSEGNASSVAYVNWAGAIEGMSLDVWGGKRYTVAATVYRNATAGDLSTGPNTPPRAIAIGIDVGGERTWVHAKSEPAPDTPGETRLTVSFDLPAGSAADFWFIRLFNGSATQPVWWDALTVEEGVTDGSFFGWDYVPHIGMRARALGAAPFAQSVLEGERIRGVGQGSRVLAIRGEIEGKPAIRMVATEHGVNAHRFASISIPTALRGGGVAMATRHQSAQFPAPTANKRALMVASPEREVAFENASGVFPLRLDYSALTGTYSMYLYHGGMPGDPDVLYTGVGMFEPGYSGPAFHGSTGLVELNGSWMAATWDGVVDNSTSTIRPAPAAARADVERSVDGGATWETIITDAALPLVLTDTEGLSNGVTTYRVTTYSADDAMSVAHHDVHANSGAVWLSGGNGYTNAARLPYSPTLSVTAGRQRVTRQYAGRELPVTHVGETRTRIVDSGGLLILEEQTPDNLADLVQDPSPIHLYRDPDGRRIYGALGDIQLQRESHAHWGFGFQLTETEH